MKTFTRESVADLWEEVSPLLRMHYEEIAYYKDIPLDPDVERYEALEKAGVFRTYVARVDGVLVGYAAFFVMPHLHYKSCLTASCDVIFVLPEYRKTSVSAGLFLFFGKELAKEGVQMELQHIKAKDIDTLGPMFEKQGYSLMDNIFVRRYGR